jgi:hypothetical protein
VELIVDRLRADRVKWEESRLSWPVGYACTTLASCLNQNRKKTDESVEKRTSMHSMAVLSSSTMTASMLRPSMMDTAVSYLRCVGLQRSITPTRTPMFVGMVD